MRLPSVKFLDCLCLFTITNAENWKISFFPLLLIKYEKVNRCAAVFDLLWVEKKVSVGKKPRNARQIGRRRKKKLIFMFTFLCGWKKMASNRPDSSLPNPCRENFCLLNEPATAKYTVGWKICNRDYHSLRLANCQ